MAQPGDASNSVASIREPLPEISLQAPAVSILQSGGQAGAGAVEMEPSMSIRSAVSEEEQVCPLNECNVMTQEQESELDIRQLIKALPTKEDI